MQAFGSEESEHVAQEAALLRVELGRLDSELSEATFSLQRRRSAFVEQVAACDAGRAVRAQEVQDALAELEIERERMEAFHLVLTGERGTVSEFEVECSHHEERLRKEILDGTREGVEEPNSGTTLFLSIRNRQKQNKHEEEEMLVACVRQRLEMAMERRATLRTELGASSSNSHDPWASANLVPWASANSVQGGHLPDPAEDRDTQDARAHELLRRAMGDLSDRAGQLTEAAASRAERRVEHATCRLEVASASLRALSVARSRREGAQTRAWDKEVHGLLDALQEVEVLAARQVTRARWHARRGRGSTVGNRTDEVAAIHHAVAAEMRASLEAALAPEACARALEGSGIAVT